MRPSPIPRARSEGEPSAFAPPEAGGSKPTAHKGPFPILSHRTCADTINEHHPRAFQQPTTDAAAKPDERKYHAAAGVVGSAKAANRQEVSISHGEG